MPNLKGMCESDKLTRKEQAHHLLRDATDGQPLHVKGLCRDLIRVEYDVAVRLESQKILKGNCMHDEKG